MTSTRPGGSPDRATDPAAMSYADAAAELDHILAALDGDHVDVDVLAAHVERAALLITVCRDRISAARIHVERAVADLTDSTASPGGADGTPGTTDLDDDTRDRTNNESDTRDRTDHSADDDTRDGTYDEDDDDGPGGADEDDDGPAHSPDPVGRGAAP